MYVNAYSSFINQKLETTKCLSGGEWINRLVNTYNRILVGDKKERSIDSLNNMNESFLVVKYT